MNEHILLVMKWLNNNDSVSIDELRENRKSAAAAAADIAAAKRSAAAIAAAIAAAYAAYAADDAAYATTAVDNFFQQTGEDKQSYIDALEKENE